MQLVSSFRAARYWLRRQKVMLLLPPTSLVSRIFTWVYSMQTIAEPKLHNVIAPEQTQDEIFSKLRRNKRSKLTWAILFQGCLLGFFGGALYHNLNLASIKLVSTTFAAALYNLSPAFTYVVAVLFRLETFSLKPQGIAKVLGTAISIGGAMLLTFYKGFDINIWHSKIDLLCHHHHEVPQNNSGVSVHREVLGLGMALIASLSCAFWNVLQAKMSENYPYYYSSTSLMSLTGSIQAVLYAICFDREWDQWKLGWNIRLLSVIYLGIVASGLMVTLMVWCIAKRGPLFVSIFNPLMLLVTALLGSVVLQEKLHLGSILGGILIIIGLYMVLWGKSKDLADKIPPISPITAGDKMIAADENVAKVLVTTPSKDINRSDCA